MNMNEGLCQRPMPRSRGYVCVFRVFMLCNAVLNCTRGAASAARTATKGVCSKGTVHVVEIQSCSSSSYTFHYLYLPV